MSHTWRQGPATLCAPHSTSRLDPEMHVKLEEIKNIARIALDRWETVAAAIDPGYELCGNEVVMLNPRTGDRTRKNFTFNRTSGVWKDFAEANAAGADLVSLWAYAKDHAYQGTAAANLAAVLGVGSESIPSTPDRPRQEKAPLSPVPTEAVDAIPRFLDWARRCRQATGEYWQVKDQEGRLLLLRVRLVPLEKNKKEVRPFSWSAEKGQWRAGGDFMPWLYGLDRLATAPMAPVLIVEGEKTADAAARLFPDLVALGFMGTSSARKVDLTPLRGREVILWPDADTTGIDAARTLAARLHQEGNPVRLVELPEAVMAWSKPGNAGPGGWDLADEPPARVELSQILEAAQPWRGVSDAPEQLGEKPLPTRVGPYSIHKGCMAKDKDSEPSPLCNFTARIREELVLDDGEVERTMFVIDGARMDGRPFQKIQVDASVFSGLGWVMSYWGASAIINAGTAIKDSLRAAIQNLSMPKERKAFTHTGWRKAGETWCFLHAGGAIGPDGPVEGIETALDAKLARYALPAPLEGPALAQAFRSSMGILDLGPVSVTAPVWLAPFRASLGECPFSIHLSGSKGQGKSELAGIAAGHFGVSLAADAPLDGWESTATALGLATFYAKDVLGVIDDFRPGGNRREAEAQTKKADQLFRSAFNRVARNRAQSDARTLKGDKIPRGLIFSTGEDLPDGESLRSRVLCLEWGAGMMNWHRMTSLQADRAHGLHAGLMAAFIQWQARDRDRVLQLLHQAHAHACKLLRDSVTNNRTGDIAAKLWSAWPVLKAFAVENDIITPSKAELLQIRLWNAFLAMTGAQAEIIQEANQADRFMHAIRDGLASARFHLLHAHPGPIPEELAPCVGWRGDEAKGVCIGYIAPKDGEVWLIPTSAYFEAERMGGAACTMRALWKRLADDKALVLGESDRNQAKRSPHSQGRSSFVVLRLSRLLDLSRKPDVSRNGVGAELAENQHYNCLRPESPESPGGVYTPPADFSHAAGDDWGEA